MKHAAAALMALLLPVVPVSAQGQGEVASAPGAILRGLDKINGQTVDVELFSGGGRSVLGVEVELADCRYPVSNPTGDAYAFLTIREPGKTETAFQGWMIASAPALNPLDHSRYDVWVLRCITS